MLSHLIPRGLHAIFKDRIAFPAQLRDWRKMCVIALASNHVFQRLELPLPAEPHVTEQPNLSFGFFVIVLKELGTSLSG